MIKEKDIHKKFKARSGRKLDPKEKNYTRKRELLEQIEDKWGENNHEKVKEIKYSLLTLSLLR